LLKASFLHTASPWRGGARPEGCGERGILAYPPARRKGGGVGNRRRISEAEPGGYWIS